MPLSEVEATQTERIATGLFDEVFGGGLAVNSVNLWGGGPGAGKSTGTLQLANFISHEENKTIYLVSEEAAADVKQRADRLQLEHLGNILICDVSSADGDELDITSSEVLEMAGDFMATVHPRLVIIDSLGMISGTFRSQVDFCLGIKKLCDDFRSPAIIIQHVNKKREMAGLMKLQHAVTALFIFSVDKKGIRTLRVEKNRQGAAPLEQRFTMGEHGLVGVKEKTR